MKLDARVPEGPIEAKWQNRKFELKLVNPANRRRYSVVVVGTGLAGASAAAALGEQGFRVLALCIQDSARRAHSIAAQGGINAAKNYQNDSDSVYRLFYDTVKGGDYRAREANVFRLAELANAIIDHAVAQGVPFAREYSGLLENRSFGGAQVSRTFYARGQTGQQLLLGAYGALMREVHAGTVTLLTRREMVDLAVVDGRAQGVLVRNLLTGALERYPADAVLLATGGYSRVFYLSTNAMGCNVSAALACYRRGAGFANPCFTQIHPTCIPVHGDRQSKLTLMSESLRNDGRVWVPRSPGDKRAPEAIPERERRYFLEERYPAFGNLVPRDVASRASKSECDAGRGVGATGLAVYLDFQEAIGRLGRATIAARYGNLFEMYAKITGEDPYETPMRIYPALHYTMGGLWVDYNLMTTVPGLFALGEANFSDHGANRLGASALMQGLADGYFIAPATVAGYLATAPRRTVDERHAVFDDLEREHRGRVERLLAIQGHQPADQIHRRLGLLLWDKCGMSRTDAGLAEALRAIPEIRERFFAETIVPGQAADLNTELERALRVADFIDFGELMVRDALLRRESAGGHFREEHQTEDNEARRDDEHFSHVAVWEHTGPGAEPRRHEEPLAFEHVKPSSRSYK